MYSVFLEGNSAMFYEATGKCSHHSPGVTLPGQTAPQVLRPGGRVSGLDAVGRRPCQFCSFPSLTPMLAAIPSLLRGLQAWS